MNKTTQKTLLLAKNLNLIIIKLTYCKDIHLLFICRYEKSKPNFITFNVKYSNKSNENKLYHRHSKS